ncbi:MAG TPA: glycosyltransferase family 39 protein [Planctomycetota bacterium]|nr:glycosyltransferase family 39 protein [Planctomycetota bacterium]
MTRRPLLAVLLVLGLAAALRVQGLSRWSLDGDELYSYYGVQKLLDGHAEPGVRSYPLGYVLMAGSAALLGLNELGLRAASALCGLLAVAALLWLRRDAVPAGEALVAALLAALSPWLVYHSQEARFYAPLLLFATLATLHALPGPRQRPWRALLCGVLAALCHPSALLLLPCLVVPPLARRFPLRAVLAATAAGAVAGGAWLLWGGSTLPRIVQAALARHALASYDTLHLLAGLGYAVGPAALLLVAAGAWPALRAPAPGDRLLLACAVVPVALLLGLSLLAASVQQRYAMAAVPALLLLAGRGAVALARRPTLRGALVAAAVLAPAPQLWALARDGDRSDMRGAAAWLARNAAPDDIFVADEHALLDLYFQRQGWEQAQTSEEDLTRKQLDGFPRSKHDVWVVLKANRLGGTYGADFETWLAQYFTERARIGPPPPLLVRHDNQLVVYQRTERVR